MPVKTRSMKKAYYQKLLGVVKSPSKKSVKVSKVKKSLLRTYRKRVKNSVCRKTKYCRKAKGCKKTKKTAKKKSYCRKIKNKRV